ncbi:hypothetical protein [Erythrobacter sp. R86502]|uniref:hypothetical protein n=1 Tax=Erythrobacter sp. R86502 TaxID=3093846 RepID=UPI0036D3DF7E
MPLSAIRSASICLLIGGLGLTGWNPVSAQTAPERGVFVTQIGENAVASVTQTNADSFARIVQEGDGNEVELDQNGAAVQRAQIVQNGDNNNVLAQQEGSVVLALAQEGNQNIAVTFQNESLANAQTTAAVVQSGNGNSLMLAQDGSNNSAELNQVGDDNTMTATQLGNSNQLEWTQIGNGLSDLGIVQTGNGNLQITQSAAGAQFTLPPGSGG